MLKKKRHFGEINELLHVMLQYEFVSRDQVVSLILGLQNVVVKFTFDSLWYEM